MRLSTFSALRRDLEHLNFNFFRYIHIFESRIKILVFSYLIWPISRKKIHILYKKAIFESLDTKTDFAKKCLKLLANVFSKIFWEIFYSPKMYNA